jgi:hypothetical protein
MSDRSGQGQTRARQRSQTGGRQAAFACGLSREPRCPTSPLPEASKGFRRPRFTLRTGLPNADRGRARRVGRESVCVEARPCPVVVDRLPGRKRVVIVRHGRKRIGSSEDFRPLKRRSLMIARRGEKGCPGGKGVVGTTWRGWRRLPHPYRRIVRRSVQTGSHELVLTRSRSWVIKLGTESCQPYPSDVTDDGWAFGAPYPLRLPGPGFRGSLRFFHCTNNYHTAVSETYALQSDVFHDRRRRSYS